VAEGVGYAFREYEDPLPPLGRPHVGRSEHDPLRIVPAFGQAPENGVETSAPQRSHILEEHEGGLDFANGSEHLVPEAAPRAGEPCSPPGEGDVLARETGSKEIHSAAPRAAVEG
jgi:hypothetical protein